MKRKRSQRDVQCDSKRRKVADDPNPKPHHPLLRCYYPEVLTLRQYLCSRLSKKRRKRLQLQGRDGSLSVGEDVLRLLDTTFIGSFKRVPEADASILEEDITIFTQQLSTAAGSATLSPAELKYVEIVDCAIWLLFRRQAGTSRPQHLLCHGFQKYATMYSEIGPVQAPGIPGVYAVGHNNQVETLKKAPWSALPHLLGNGAAGILTDLLVDCGVFIPVGDSSNWTQLSGIPMSELKVIEPSAPLKIHIEDVAEITSELQTAKEKPSSRGLSEIRFVRHRMLYARAKFTSKQSVRAGLDHMHALNRYHNVEDDGETDQVMKYIFPSQFGLHNVFTSDVNVKDTAQPFQDYTNREPEIARQARVRERKVMAAGKTTAPKAPSLPKRLRGKAKDLVRRIRKGHLRCSYAALLNHHCPRPTSTNGGTASVSWASAASQVSAFSRAAVSKVFPRDLWGSNKTATHNIRVLHRNVDLFIRFRRYESITLHSVMQDMRLATIDWLAPPKLVPSDRISKSDLDKRRELIAELLYYLFDSFLIPLIRGHFYVTESSAQRNQLFYFRHDIWKEMSDPALTSLKHTMLEECNSAVVKKMLAKRALGVSHVRFLPKEVGMRPIINLRRRTQKLQHGKLVLGRSINSLLTPAFSVLNYEKNAHPEMTGSALFSVDDIFPRLQAYRQTLECKGMAGRPLYFAKVDVQACFDTIPQKRLMQLARKILGSDEYGIARYSRAKLAGGHDGQTPGFGAKPSWKFLTKAVAGTKALDFQREVENDTADGRSRTVFINGIAQRTESRRAMLTLLEEHVESNLIKIGRRFYRQKEGIPQGSIVSSLLCSYFYAELERDVLGFVNDGRSVLLRLIDDFLVISTERETVEKFMRVMHRGVLEFGVKVKLEKSQANFDISIDGKPVSKLPQHADFPYCGNAIDPVTLNLSKDKERRRKSNIPDSVTVEYSKLPGQSFYRKTLNALKLQMHAMLLSTSYNHISTVLSNLHHSFTEVAQKSYHYIKSLPPAKQPADRLTIRAIDDLIKLACVLMRRRRWTRKDVMPYACSVTDGQARWLACTAFVAVFQRRQTKHAQLLVWLRLQVTGLAVRGQQRGVLEEAVRSNV